MHGVSGVILIATDLLSIKGPQKTIDTAKNNLERVEENEKKKLKSGIEPVPLDSCAAG